MPYCEICDVYCTDGIDGYLYIDGHALCLRHVDDIDHHTCKSCSSQIMITNSQCSKCEKIIIGAVCSGLDDIGVCYDLGTIVGKYCVEHRWQIWQIRKK